MGQMTNEQAIELLNHTIIIDIDDERKARKEEAIRMGADALKAQKVGRWIKTPKAVMGEGYMWYCDKCEHQVYQDSSRDYPSENYCPNCGAKNRKMEGQK